MRRTIIATSLLIFGLLSSVPVFAAQTTALRIGQTKRTPGNVRVKFIEIVEDSRCPIGTDCIWAGRVIIRVEVKGKNGRPRTAELEAGKPESTVSVDGVTISLSSVDPHPKADKKPSNREYIARITVKRSR